MSLTEKELLLPSRTTNINNDQQPFLSHNTFNTLPRIPQTKKVKTLSLFFAVLCIVDLFGVFPIMSLPGPIIQCGIYGIPLVIIIATVQIYTAVLLGRCWLIAEKLDPSIVKKNRYPYAAIADMTYGKYMSFLVTILLDLTVFGAGIPNLLVAAENLQLLGEHASVGKVNVSFCILLIVIGIILCPLMWLGSPKNIKNVATISVVTIGIMSVLLWYCIGTISLNKQRRQKIMIKTELPTLMEVLTAYGIMAFQFDIHPMLLTIQVDMQHKDQIGKAVIYGVSTTLSMAAISTALCAIKFGAIVPPNILDSIPQSGPLYAVILLVTLQLCLSSAVGTNALFQHIESLLGISQDFTAQRCLVRSSLIAFEVIIAELLPRFDIIMGLIGGTLTGPLIFIFPPLFYSKISKLERRRRFELQQTILYQRGPIYDDDIILLEETLGQPFQSPLSDGTVVIQTSFLWKIWRRIKRLLKVLFSDCFISLIILILGLAATVWSTYYNYFQIGKMGASYPDIVFLSFDTYNPPTPSHFRIFEVAKDHFEQINKCHVILGIIVPTDFESKGEAEIVSLHHRIAMIELFLKSSVWIQLSDKVCTKGGSNSIKYILQAHQNVINNVIKASASDKQIDRPSWLPQDLQFKGKVQVKFLGAADILEKYFAPKEKQAENVLKEILENNGLVVVSNSGLYCEKFIFYSDLLSMHKQNITLVTNWASNNVTSSLIRRLLSRGQSVKYLLDDAVINYINDNKLYMHFYVSNTEHKLPQMLPTLKIKASDAIAFQYKPEFSYISSEEKNKSQEKTRKHPLPCNEDLSEFLKFAIETKRIKAVRREQYFV